MTFLVCLALLGAQDSVDALLTKVRIALKQGQNEVALDAANKAVQLDPKSVPAYVLRGVVHESARRFPMALADFDKAIQLDPKAADAYDFRGSVYFKLAKIPESMADFDKFLQLRPDQRPGHWRRGITCYYADQFDEGRKQFGAYETVNTNDVENAVWHLMCAARVEGLEKARMKILKIGFDRRIPMMKVYDLFAGKAKPEDVMTTALTSGGKPADKELSMRLFYAHLYLGLYFEMIGDAKKALEHVTKAEETQVGGYMWDVARVHRELLAKAEKK